MKYFFFLSALCLSTAAFAHCPMDFSEANLCGDVKWIDGPHLDVKSHFQLIFWKKGDASHTPTSPDFDIDIYSWMTMDNGNSHGGPKMNFLEMSAGVFEVKDARFFMHGMHGYWEVRADLLLGSNLISRAASKVGFDGNSNGHHE